MGGLDLLDGLGVLRGPVLDVLRLVENSAREAHLRVALDVQPDKRIGSDYEVVGADGVPVVVAVSAGHCDDAHLRHEPLRLVAPVLDEARRAHDEGGDPLRGAAAALQLEPGQRLERLAEAHLVGEDAARAVCLQEAKPGDALLLVRAQDAVKRLAQGHRLDALLMVLRLSAAAPVVWRVAHDVVLERLYRGEEVRRVDVVEMRNAVLRDVHLRAFREDVAQLLHGVRVEQIPLAAALDERLAHPQRPLHLHRRDGRPVGGARADADLEPVHVAEEAGLRALRDLHEGNCHVDVARELRDRPLEHDLPAHAPEFGHGAAQELVDVFRAHNRVERASVAAAEAHVVEPLHCERLAFEVAHLVAKNVLRIRNGEVRHDVRGGRRQGDSALVLRVERHDARRLGASHLHGERRLGRHELKKRLVDFRVERRERAQLLLLLAHEAHDLRARNRDRLGVDALVRPRQHAVDFRDAVLRDNPAAVAEREDFGEVVGIVRARV